MNSEMPNSKVFAVFLHDGIIKDVEEWSKFEPESGIRTEHISRKVKKTINW